MWKKVVIFCGELLGACLAVGGGSALITAEWTSASISVLVWLGLAVAITKIDLFEGQRKRRRRIGNAVIVIAVAPVLWGVWWIVRPPPISVSPKEIVLSSDSLPFRDQNLEVQSEVKVYNRTSDPYYQIWVKISIDSSTITPQQIEINVPGMRKGDAVIEDFVTNPPSHDFFYLDGTDKNGRKALMFFIKNLDPNALLTLELICHCPTEDELDKLKPSKASISIVNYMEEAPLIARSKRSGKMRFYFPEKFEVRQDSMRYFVKE